MNIFRREPKIQNRVLAFGGRNFFRARSVRAFTLIEIMMVVAIMGLMAAMGLPSIMMALKKEGMRKAVDDIEQVCSEARGRAITHNQNVCVVFYPEEKKFEVERRRQVAGLDFLGHVAGRGGFRHAGHQSSGL